MSQNFTIWQPFTVKWWSFEHFPKFLRNSALFALYKKSSFSLRISSVDVTKSAETGNPEIRIWSHLLKKFVMENFIFCAVLPSIFNLRKYGLLHYLICKISAKAQWQKYMNYVTQESGLLKMLFLTSFKFLPFYKILRSGNT